MARASWERVCRRGLIAAAASALLAGGAAAPPARAVEGIHVFPAGAGNELVTFFNLSCRSYYSRFARHRVFSATSAGPWKLTVYISPFSTYKTYSIPRDLRRPVLFTIDGPGGQDYSNINNPDVPLPPVGGAVSFPGGRTTLGLGYVNAWNLANTAAVTLSGRATCRYPPVRRR